MQAEFGNYTDAITNLEKAVALQQDSYEFRYNLGLAYHRNGDGGRAHYRSWTRSRIPG